MCDKITYGNMKGKSKMKKLALVLIFADPYDVTDHKQDGYYTYPLGRFFGMWREGPCAEKTQPYQQPFVATWPK